MPQFEGRPWKSDDEVVAGEDWGHADNTTRLQRSNHSPIRASIVWGYTLILEVLFPNTVWTSGSRPQRPYCDQRSIVMGGRMREIVKKAKTEKQLAKLDLFSLCARGARHHERFLRERAVIIPENFLLFFWFSDQRSKRVTQGMSSSSPSFWGYKVWVGNSNNPFGGMWRIFFGAAGWDVFSFRHWVIRTSSFKNLWENVTLHKRSTLQGDSSKVETVSNMNIMTRGE